MARKFWRRKRLIADLQVQGALAVRAVLYWLLCLVTIGTLMLVAQLLAAPLTPMNQQLAELWSHFRPMALTSLLLLPIVLFDLLLLTNRFAGPVFRLRRAMHDLAQGKSVRPIRFRKGDFWPQVGNDFNIIAGRLRQADASSAGEIDTAPDEGELVGAVGVKSL